jgi:hypothetical protein
MPLLTVLGAGEGTGATASADRAGSAGAAVRAGRRGECRGAPASQQCSLPRQVRCPLGNLARASLSVMQVAEL